MELRTTREMRRSAQLDKAMAKKADAPDTSSGGLIQSAQKQAEDRCTLSKQAAEQAPAGAGRAPGQDGAEAFGAAEQEQ